MENVLNDAIIEIGKSNRFPFGNFLKKLNFAQLRIPSLVIQKTNGKPRKKGDTPYKFGNTNKENGYTYC